ncbi:MAG: DUF2147 domain-containing protein [Saprospiraceae bacterium]
MKYLLFLTFSVITCTLYGQKTNISTSDSIIGNWSVLNNQAAIAISKNKDVFEGRIIWLSELNDDNDLPKLDINNNEKSKRNQPLMQMICLYDFKYNPTSGNWENGFFYNPFTGEIIKATLRMKDANTIEMTGFAGFSLEFVSKTWVRF